jgi:hypothetical protein
MQRQPGHRKHRVAQSDQKLWPHHHEPSRGLLLLLLLGDRADLLK